MAQNIFLQVLFGLFLISSLETLAFSGDGPCLTRDLWAKIFLTCANTRDLSRIPRVCREWNSILHSGRQIDGIETDGSSYYFLVDRYLNILEAKKLPGDILEWEELYRLLNDALYRFLAKVKTTRREELVQALRRRIQSRFYEVLDEFLAENSSQCRLEHVAGLAGNPTIDPEWLPKIFQLTEKLNDKRVRPILSALATNRAMQYGDSEKNYELFFQSIFLDNEFRNKRAEILLDFIIYQPLSENLLNKLFQVLKEGAEREFSDDYFLNDYFGALVLLLSSPRTAGREWDQKVVDFYLHAKGLNQQKRAKLGYHLLPRVLEEPSVLPRFLVLEDVKLSKFVGKLLFPKKTKCDCHHENCELQAIYRGFDPEVNVPKAWRPVLFRRVLNMTDEEHQFRALSEFNLNEKSDEVFLNEILEKVLQWKNRQNSAEILGILFDAKKDDLAWANQIRTGILQWKNSIHKALVLSKFYQYHSGSKDEFVLWLKEVRGIPLSDKWQRLLRSEVYANVIHSPWVTPTLAMEAIEELKADAAENEAPYGDKIFKRLFQSRTLDPEYLESYLDDPWTLETIGVSSLYKAEAVLDSPNITEKIIKKIYRNLTLIPKNGLELNSDLYGMKRWLKVLRKVINHPLSDAIQERKMGFDWDWSNPHPGLARHSYDEMEREYKQILKWIEASPGKI